jgi:1-deoxy-D-xylulose-5-phosphate synthase
VSYGALLGECVAAAEALQRKHGMDVEVINARFAKPLDRKLFARVLRTAPFVITVEEAALMGGFGSALLELASDLGLDASRLRRLGIPDQFVEHGERRELLAEFGLDADGIRRTCLEMTHVDAIGAETASR